MPVRTPVNKSTGLASSAFARHYLRNLGWCLFLPLLRCFSSGRSLRTPIWFNARYWSIAPVGFPIRKSPDQRIFAPPRSLSQLITSFIGSQCQGIRPAPFVAWPFLARCCYCTKPVASDPTGSRRKALPFQSLLGSNATTNCSLCDPLNLRLLSFSLVDNCNL